MYQGLAQDLTPKLRTEGILPDCELGEAWTGGSNIAPDTMVTYLTQRHPTKYSASQALLNKIEAGLPEKLGSTGEDTEPADQPAGAGK